MPDRFPIPWSVHPLEESWEVRDAAGFKITWFHFGDKRSPGLPERMTREQAYAMAVSFCRWAKEDAEKRK